MPRYIDAEQKITVTYYDEEHEEWSQKTKTIYDFLDEAADEEIPTADVRENVHAHWEGDGQCSNCKGYPLARYMRNPNFCPNCGAKMETDDAEIH